MGISKALNPANAYLFSHETASDPSGMWLLKLSSLLKNTTFEFRGHENSILLTEITIPFFQAKEETQYIQAKRK
jgi:hypothetical protein